MVDLDPKLSRIDLHIHSSYSDGSLSPEKLVDLAVSKNIKMLSLTDHDTTDGLALARKAAQASGIAFINGVELSSQYLRGACHILGYFVSEHNENFNNMLVKVRKARQERNKAIIEKLQSLNIAVEEQELLDSVSAATVVGRPHIASLLVKKKIVSNYHQAFKQYLGQTGRAYVARSILSPQDCIDYINKAGGWAFLAHPKTLHVSLSELVRFVLLLKDCGLKGIEVYNSCHTKQEIINFQKIANKYQLYISGGSDFHGQAKTNVQLGKGNANGYILASHLTEQFFEKYHNDLENL